MIIRRKFQTISTTKEVDVSHDRLLCSFQLNVPYRCSGSAGWPRWCSPGRSRRLPAGLLSWWRRWWRRCPPPSEDPRRNEPCVPAEKVTSSHANLQLTCTRPSAWSVPDVSVSGSVLQEPAVRCLVLPADVASVFPQEFHLVTCVAGVPQGVPQVLTWARVWLDRLFEPKHDRRSESAPTCLSSRWMWMCRHRLLYSRRFWWRIQLVTCLAKSYCHMIHIKTCKYSRK